MSLEQKIPDGAIVIPHTHPLSWIMMFYALPKEMFENLPKYRQLPSNMRDIQVSEKYMRMINCDNFLIMIWSLYAWMVWHCLRVPGKNGEYRPISGAWGHYSEDFPIWRMTYEIGMHFRELFERCSNWKVQRLFDLKKDEEMPWLSLPDFCTIVKTMTQFVIDNMNLQPLIDEVWYHRAEEDYAGENYAYRDFMRSWTHSRTASSVSIDEIIESGAQVDGQVIFDLPDPRAAFEEYVVSTVKIDQFKERLTEKDRIILQMRNDDHTLQEIADEVGYKTASAVQKRIKKIAAEYNDFVSAEFSDFLATHIK